MTKLSPAAEAVLNAYEKSNDCYREEWGQLAAALRAAADEVCLRWAEQQHPADVLNNIADELDPQ